MTTLLITGGNRGLGLEHTRQALAAGERVIATCQESHSAAALLELQRQYPDHLRIENLEVTNGASVAALAKALAGVPIDILINNAGTYGGIQGVGFGEPQAEVLQSLTQMDYDRWEQVLRTNLLGSFRVTAAVLENLRAGSRRVVIMMSSDLASIAGNTLGKGHAYRTSKAGINMAARGLAVDLALEKFIVVALAPGWVKTDMGGPNAPWELADSITRQRQVIASLTLAQSGQFLNLEGQQVPW